MKGGTKAELMRDHAATAEGGGQNGHHVRGGGGAPRTFGQLAPAFLDCIHENVAGPERIEMRGESVVDHDQKVDMVRHDDTVACRDGGKDFVQGHETFFDNLAVRSEDRSAVLVQVGQDLRAAFQRQRDEKELKAMMFESQFHTPNVATLWYERNAK